jgi:hypothetical protein
MRHLARQFLCLLVVAVAMGASAMNGYAAVLSAFDIHAHGHHGVHSHPSHDDHGVDDHGIDVHVDHADLDQDQQDSDPASTEQPCAHAHVHCCSSVAVPAGDCSLKLVVDTRETVLVADSHVPHGQLASPLFRPPRAVA